MAYNFWMDHRTVAIISISGIGLDVLGGIYLAYDLLGGQHGPLRLLTRMVTYSIVFGIGYGFGLGLVFGVACSLATGITMAIELQRASLDQDHYPLRWEAVFGAIRGASFGIALFLVVGLPFALTFAALITLGQTFAYSRGMRPGIDYSPSRRPRITRRQKIGVAWRTIGYIASATLRYGGRPHRASVAVRDSRWSGHGRGDSSRHHDHSVYRILRRQSSGTAPRRLWNLAGAVRVCSPIGAVLVDDSGHYDVVTRADSA